MKESQSQADNKKDSSIDRINQIKQFRENPKFYLDKVNSPKNRKKKQR